jgi:dihydroxy-acid dehydratase
MFTLEQVGKIYTDLLRCKISQDEYRFLQRSACPTEGCCSFMGTANTMQAMSEALGLALPGSASMPAFAAGIRHKAEEAGARIVEMLDDGIKTKDILTKDAFENAIMVHAALAGSTNAMLHLPSIAREVGIELRPMLWDELNRKIPQLLNVRPSGQYPAILFWYAGGVQGVIRELKDHLHMQALTVTGKTLGENLKDLEKQHFFEHVSRHLESYKIKAEEVIFPAARPIGMGSLAILHGNLAPSYAIIKHAAVPKEMFHHTGPAIVFEDELSARDAILDGNILPGSVIPNGFTKSAKPGIIENISHTVRISCPNVKRSTRPYRTSVSCFLTSPTVTCVCAASLPIIPPI